ncbi:MAG: pyruvate carboxylase subunit B, partial [Gammaproteobacteria bacterium]|nr:pyruvate carboxylase subunit B [Gammaproteobacteria bacterium]
LGYRHYSDDVVRAFIERCAADGIDVFRIFDALNDTRNMQVSIEAVKAQDRHAQGAICYTTSPVHDTASFVAMGKELERMGCDSIAIKDMAGLLTPQACAELVKALVEALAIPIQVHSHATAGLSALCQMKGVENGAFGIDTAISAFSGGTSHPSTESMVAAFRDTEYDSGLDLELLQEIGFYFREIRKKYHQYESEFTGEDTRVQVNQVPGGMISNLSNQLKEQGALDKMGAVLDEIPRVREDLGYPPLVTPTSQIVGTQSVLNVLTGERYKNITNEVKFYLQGRYGHAPGPVNSVVRQQAIGNEEVIEGRPADLLEPEMEHLHDQIGDLAQSPEDVLTYAMFPEIGRQFLEGRKAGTLVPEPLEPPQAQGDNQYCAIATEFNVTLHGETYHIKVTGSGHQADGSNRPMYVSVDGVPEEIMVEALDEIYASPASANGQVPVPAKSSSGRPKATEPGHVSTSMPGTIVEVLVKEGDTVAAGDPMLITEAMKMETEVQAPISGKITAVNVAKGESVNPDEALIIIE